MFDCNLDLLKYHDNEVTLPLAEQSEMSKRRNINRERLKNGLAGRGLSFGFKSQGSYAMKTMTRHPDNDYDIDDGVYFIKEELVGPRGGEFSSLQAREMVRDAVDDGSFKKAPGVHKNCVRIYYAAGYHVDMPVYRQVSTTNFFSNVTVHYELASSEWKRSDAKQVTDWFDAQNQGQSPDTTNGRQLRRIVRLLKKFAKSRSSWETSILSGFGITKLVTERYRKDNNRDDLALFNTMQAIRDRLDLSLTVAHPVTPGANITSSDADPKARVLREKLTDALNWLQPLESSTCSRQQALACWDTVFNTNFFSQRYQPEAAEAKSLGTPNANIYHWGLVQNQEQPYHQNQPVRKEGDGRYA